MRAMRRIVFPVVWIAVFAVIAVALVKIAFLDGLKPGTAVGAPAANIEPVSYSVAKGNIDNVVEIKGMVRSDPAIPVLSNAIGEVVKIFVDAKAAVAEGDPLFQVKTEVKQAPNSDPQAPPSKPVYKYSNVLAPAGGTLQNFQVLLEQQVSIGQNVGSIGQQSLSIEGSLDSAQQFRLLNKPTTSTATVNNGPAPFECPNVVISAADLDSKPGAGSNGPAGSSGGAGNGGMAVPAASGAGPGSGQGGAGSGTGDDAALSGKVTCKVPAGTPVFAGLGAKLSLVAGSAKDVVVVPLTAVKGTFQSGLVWLQGEQGPQERKVTLGLNDGKMVEVTAGLAVGDGILRYVPGAAADRNAGCPPGAACSVGPGPVVSENVGG